MNRRKASVLSGRTGYLRGIFDGGPDIQVWDDILRSVPDEARNWVDAPWLISEFYYCEAHFLGLKP
jgi:hypothetical protein